MRCAICTYAHVTICTFAKSDVDVSIHDEMLVRYVLYVVTTLIQKMKNVSCMKNENEFVHKVAVTSVPLSRVQYRSL